MSSLRIPLVDLSSSVEEIIQVIGEACRDLGFFQVVNAGVDAEIAAAQAAAHEFFMLPLSEKDSFRLCYGEGELLFGYASVGRESADVANLSLTGQKQYTDLMESFQLADPKLMHPDAKIPSSLQGPLSSLFSAYHVVGARLLGYCARAFGVEPAVFQSAHEHAAGSLSRHRTVVRVTRYPKLSEVIEQGEVGVTRTRISPHSDLGTLTLLAQDEQGGLEVQDPQSLEWHPVPPLPGALVINVGNLMMRWTDGHFRSSIHRVVPCATADTQDRYSVIMFMNPNDNVEIGPLTIKGDRPSYEPVNVGEYLDCKFEQIFNPAAREEKGSCIYDD